MGTSAKVHREPRKRTEWHICLASCKGHTYPTFVSNTYSHYCNDKKEKYLFKNTKKTK